MTENFREIKKFFGRTIQLRKGKEYNMMKTRYRDVKVINEEGKITERRAKQDN